MKESVHQKIVNEIVEEQKKDTSVIAIALFGSLARGEERSDSDVDIEVISTKAKDWELKQDEKRYGIQIDFQITPKDKLLRNIKEYPYLCYDYLTEKVIYDPEGFMKRIRKELKKYFDKHPEVVDFWEKKLKVMKGNKKKRQDPKDAIKSYDEAEILFSDEHKVTRDFFRE